MKILLAGSSGFIGKNFIMQAPEDWQIHGVYRSNPDFHSFASKRPNLSAVKCDLKDSVEAKDKLSSLPDYFDVGLFVWGNSDIGYSYLRPADDLNDNLVSLINLVSNKRFGKFIFMSSGTVYMGQKGLVDSNKLILPSAPYGISKFSSELYLRFFAQKTERIESFVNIRFFGAYGPMEPSRKIFTKMVKQFCFDKKNVFTLSGDGTNLIDAMYIDDCIDALQKIIRSNNTNVTVDICRGEPMTLKDLVKKAAGILGVKDLRIEYKGESSENITFFASPKCAQELFGFKAQTGIEEGIIKLKDYLTGEKYA